MSIKANKLSDLDDSPIDVAKKEDWDNSFKNEKFISVRRGGIAVTYYHSCCHQINSGIERVTPQRCKIHMGNNPSGNKLFNRKKVS